MKKEAYKRSKTDEKSTLGVALSQIDAYIGSPEIERLTRIQDS